MWEENKRLVRRLIEDVISKGDLDVVDELLAPDYSYHGPGMEIAGPDGIKQVFAMIRAGFPDWYESIEDLIAEGDRVVFRVVGRGTQSGEFMGIPATGRPVAVQGIDVVRIAGDKIAEHWAVFDQLGMMQQLGAIPTPGQP